MADRKETKKYIFTVEGETEQWYLYWLRDQINACEKATYNVSIVASVQQSPRSYSKTVNAKSTPNITHLCDIESNECEHINIFFLRWLKLKNRKKFNILLGIAILPLNFG